MRFLVALLTAGILVSCGTEGPTEKGTRTARDGRIYVANEGRWEVDDTHVLENPATGESGLWARLKSVDDRAVEGEFSEIPYQGGAVDICPEVIPGGSRAIVRFRVTYPNGVEREFPFDIDGSIVITVTTLADDDQMIYYDVRPYGG